MPDTVSKFGVPDLGIGVGFRVPHYGHVVDDHPPMDWFEVISENFMIAGGRVAGGSPRYFLDRLRAHYPVVPHGVSMNLAGPLDPEHLDGLAALVADLDPPWISDHLCWTGTAHTRVHDLLPVPYTPAVRDHVVARIDQVQQRLGRPFALENVSSYLGYRDSVMAEWDFLASVAEAADCALLLDVNNVFVSSVNHGFAPTEFLDHVPVDRVVQLHLAGHSIREGYRIDTHDGPVCDEVWALYAHTIRRLGSVSTLIEWDDQIPEFPRLQAEAAAARTLRDRALAGV